MAVKPYVRGGSLEDCLEVAKNISFPDRAEIMAAVGTGPEAALHYCFLMSFRCWSVMYGGRCVFVFGLAREDWRWVTPWAFSTPEVSRFPVAFLRGSRSVARRLFARYPYMLNWVDARHDKSIAWLRFMGFKLGKPQPYGVYGMDFIPFRHSKEAI